MLRKANFEFDLAPKPQKLCPQIAQCVGEGHSLGSQGYGAPMLAVWIMAREFCSKGGLSTRKLCSVMVILHPQVFFSCLRLGMYSVVSGGGQCSRGFLNLLDRSLLLQEPQHGQLLWWFCY